MVSEVAVAELVSCVPEVAVASVDAGIEHFGLPPIQLRR
jgi:hypothetical protein